MTKKDKKKSVNYVGIAVFGLALGIGIWIAKGVIIPKYFTKLTEAQKAERLVQTFKEVEAVCGKNNVTQLCSEGTNGCRIATGFTCQSWERTAHQEDFKSF